MKSNHEDHEEHKDKNYKNAFGFLRELRVLRGVAVFHKRHKNYNLTPMRIINYHCTTRRKQNDNQRGH
jgi:hypothetical protein